MWDLVGSIRISGILEQLVQLVEHDEFDRTHGILVDTSNATFEELRLSHMVSIFDVVRKKRGGRRAIVLGSRGLRKFADFFMLIRGNDGKVRFFQSREDGLSWLGEGPTGAPN